MITILHFTEMGILDYAVMFATYSPGPLGKCMHGIFEFWEIACMHGENYYSMHTTKCMKRNPFILKSESCTWLDPWLHGPLI